MTAETRSSGARRNVHYDLRGPGRIEKVVDTLSALQPTRVRVRVAFCGLCGSDLSRYRGERTARYPVSLGHEWVGVVEATGADVSGLTAGDVVTTDLNFRCGHCRQCAGGRSHLCQEGQVGQFTNRGFAARVDIHAGYLAKCERQPAPYLALAEPMSCVMHALSHCRVSPHERLLVIGAGSLGTCAAFLLSIGQPAQPFDVTDLDRDRLDRLAKVVRHSGRTVVEPTRDYDVVLDVSGSAGGLRVGCRLVTPGGRLCTMSHLADAAPVNFLMEELIHKDITLAISYLNGETTNLRRSIAMLEAAWTPEWDTLLEVHPLDELTETFRRRAASPWNKVVMDVRGSTDADPL